VAIGSSWFGSASGPEGLEDGGLAVESRADPFAQVGYPRPVPVAFVSEDSPTIHCAWCGGCDDFNRNRINVSCSIFSHIVISLSVVVGRAC